MLMVAGKHAKHQFNFLMQKPRCHDGAFFWYLWQSFKNISAIMSAKLQARFDEAYTQHERGQLDRAEAGYKAILKKDPCHVPSLYMLGLAAYQRKQYKQAVRYYSQAVELEPSDADIHFELGNSFYQLGRANEALQHIDHAIQLNPGNADFFCNRGLILRDANRSEEAIASFQTALKLSPSDGDLWLNLGDLLSTTGEEGLANTVYSQALQASQTRHKELWFGCAKNHLKQKNLRDAFHCFSQVIKMDDLHGETWNYMSIILQELREYPAAVKCSERASTLDPSNTAFLSNYAYALNHLGEHESAIRILQNALALTSNKAEILTDISWIQLRSGHYLEALKYCNQAIDLNPELAVAHFNAAVSLLATGNLQQGWKEYEWRKQIPELAHHFRKFDKPLWTGNASIQGKTIFVHAEQGMGDIFQFCRFIPLLIEQGASVILEVYPSQKTVLASLSENMVVVSTQEETPPFDIYCPIMSLPGALSVTLDSLQADSYLHANPALIHKWCDKISTTNRPKIGLVWSGNPGYIGDERRSMPLEALAPLLLEFEADWYCLQKDIRASDAPLLATLPITMLGSDFTDFAETAAAISNLDLVISVDTSVAHLSAALGQKTWVVLPLAADWRWLTDRTDSPWYPTAKLFRQQQAGDWDAVIETIIRTLKHESFEKTLNQ